VVAAATHLEDMSIDFREDVNHSSLTLKGCLGACTWPQLRSLHLCSKYENDIEELTDLVYRHRQTLKSLYLDSVRLANANWWMWARQVQPWVSSSSLEQIECDNLRYQNQRVCCLGRYLQRKESEVCFFLP
jgi:hypothetical protein